MMKKRPVRRTADAPYPSYAEIRRDRSRWLRAVAIGAAALGVAGLTGCDAVRSLLDWDDEVEVPLGGVAVEMVTPTPPDPGDDDDSAAPAAGEGNEARPDAHVRGKMVVPEQ